MTDKPDAPAPLPHGRTFRDQIWQPVRNSGWLVLLAAALGGGLIGVMANPFPAWCDAPEEAHVVCAREWVSAFGGYFGGVLTLVAAWIAFGPAKRSIEIQEMPILDARIKFLDMIGKDFIQLEVKFVNLLPSMSCQNKQMEAIYRVYTQKLALDLTQIDNQTFIIQEKLWESPSLEFKTDIQNSLSKIRSSTSKLRDITRPFFYNTSPNPKIHDSIKELEEIIYFIISECKSSGNSVFRKKEIFENKRYNIN